MKQNAMEHHESNHRVKQEKPRAARRQLRLFDQWGVIFELTSTGSDVLLKVIGIHRSPAPADKKDHLCLERQSFERQTGQNKYDQEGKLV